MLIKNSLRRQLLLWIAIPMCILIPLETTILYRIGIHFIDRSFDADLIDMGDDLISLLEISKSPLTKFTFNKEIKRVLFTDQYDKTYFAIYDENGKFVNGNEGLIFNSLGNNYKSERYFSYSKVNHELVRVLTIKTKLENTGSQLRYVYILIAETLNKRVSLSRQILLGIILPQVILLLVTMGMLQLGISKGLNPLRELNDVIAKRSDKQLNPVQLSDVPEEAKQLIESINILLAKLRFAVESQNRFIADAAHQLRTPLAGIQAQMELVKSQKDNSQQFEFINSNVKKLIHLVNQLLKLARIQPEAAISLNSKPVDIFILAKEICSDLFPFAYSKNIDLGFEFISPHNSNNYVVWGDYERLKVMLINLIDNAIRYTPNHGKVTARVDETEDEIILQVEDNGLGIPEAERDKVFERFHRVIENSQEGSGLGLSIVKEIANLHNATVSINSPANGVGTIMLVTFLKSN
jgi:two-component system, OmpR family, sensor histidine kinase TctE